MASRRRSGVVVYQTQEPRKWKKQELSLPFMDTSQGMLPGEDSLLLETTKITDSNKDSKENIINLLKFPADNWNGSFIKRIFAPLVYIQSRCSFNYEDVSHTVLSSERVKSAVKASVMDDIQSHDSIDSRVLSVQQRHRKRAVHVLHQMRSCISAFLLKIAAWVMYKLLGRILDGMEIHKDQIETVKRVSKEKNVPIIYLPLHRSHLDYILVTFILYMNDLRAPLVAAGNNLMIPFFGSLLRGLGAFFIKRKLDPRNGQRDFVYRAVLHTYMEQSLKAGHSLEFFLEGGRSRTGKAVLPKAGLLSIVVDTFMSGNIKDAYIAPIAVSYEKLLDGNFISEQLGIPKTMESFTSALQGIWRTLHSNFGSVRVDFCQPFSLKAFLQAAEISYSSPGTALQPSGLHRNIFWNPSVKSRRRSEYGTEIVSEDHRQLIKDLADYVVYDAFNAYSLMSTHILSCLLLTEHRKGATLEQLAKSMDWLMEELQKRGKTIPCCTDSVTIIQRAALLIGHNSLYQGHAFYRPYLTLPHVFQLHYYASSVLPVFLLESVVVNAMQSFEDAEDKPRYLILKRCLELCSILEFEFLFTPPGTSLCTLLNATLDELLEKSLIQIREKNISDVVLSTDLPDLIDDFFAHGDPTELHQQMKLRSEDDRMINFLRCILSPFLESYYVAACTLKKLVNRNIEETALLHEIKNMGQKQVDAGQVQYVECLGFDTFRNALKLFESWKVLTYQLQNPPKLYNLIPKYNNADKLEDIIERIAKYKA